LPEEVPEVKYRQSYQVTLGVLHGLCTWMGKEWCSSTSIMGARTLK
jgi:hypothetical protein